MSAAIETERATGMCNSVEAARSATFRQSASPASAPSAIASNCPNADIAVAIKAAISALQGNPLPQAIKLPISYVDSPNMKPGTDFYPDLSDNFFVGNSFPSCGINFTAQEIMGQSEANK